MEKLMNHQSRCFFRCVVLVAAALLFLGCSKEGEERLSPEQKAKITFDSIRAGVFEGSTDIYANVYNGSNFFVTRIQLRLSTEKGDRDFNMFVMIPPLSSGFGKVENCYPLAPLKYTVVDVYGSKERPRAKQK
jgi:hypothetical protein